MSARSTETGRAPSAARRRRGRIGGHGAALPTRSVVHGTVELRELIEKVATALEHPISTVEARAELTDELLSILGTAVGATIELVPAGSTSSAADGEQQHVALPASAPATEIVISWPSRAPRSPEVDAAIQLVVSVLGQVGNTPCERDAAPGGFETATTPMTIRDLDLRLVDANQAYLELVGMTRSTLIGTRPWSLEAPPSTDEVASAAEPARRPRDPRGPTGPDGGRDELTGLGDRRLLTAALERLWSRPDDGPPARFALLVLDVDRFKVINDSLGHSIGDRLLQLTATRLAIVVDSEMLLCRLGGDEFVVVVPEPTSRPDVVSLAQRLLQVVERPALVEGFELFPTVSIGVAFRSDEDTSFEDVLRHADAAMYAAKDRGRNRYEVYAAQLGTRVERRAQAESRLHRAVGTNELDVLFQPEVSLQNGRILSVEALVRWSKSTNVHMSAPTIIQLAEDTGRIFDLGAWVLEESCRRLAGWLADPLLIDVMLRVNLSARQLGHPELVDHVRSILASTGLPASRLCLEITETTLMADIEAALSILADLHGLGVQLALDDFGTGYSSLSYLKRLPVDVLKIDQSFVRGLAHDPQDELIVAAVVRLARALGMDVVAEGVETTAQAQRLLRLDCRRGQGYLFARPCSESDLVQLLRIGYLEPVE